MAGLIAVVGIAATFLGIFRWVLGDWKSVWTGIGFFLGVFAVGAVAIGAVLAIIGAWAFVAQLVTGGL